MKKLKWACIMALVFGVVLFPMIGDAHMGRGYGPGYGQGYGPGCGYGMMGSGYGYGMMGRMMGPGYGYGMMGNMTGPGYGYGMMGNMMGPGYGYGYGGQYGPQYQQPQQPLDETQAKQEVENYLKARRNPNLKVGKVEEKGNDYVVDVETKDGSLMDRIVVNKYTG
jgi:hypothetical protein